jgi:hypothetical protein
MAKRQTKMDSPLQNLLITNAEAVVLFEFLTRFSSEEVLKIESSAEEKVLWKILAQLERTLVEPFSENWKDILDEARRKVEADY